MDKYDLSEKMYDLDVYEGAHLTSPEKKTKLDEMSFVVMPASYKDDERYYSQEAVDFVKYCREEDSTHLISLLDDDDVVSRSLHSIDIWMPIIWVAEKALLPIVVSLVSRYIYEKIKGREGEKTNVDVEFHFKEGKRVRTIHYKGDIKNLEDVLRKKIK